MNNYDIVSIVLDFEEWLQKRNLSDSSVYVYVAAVKKFLITKPDLESVDAYNEFIFEHSIKKRSNYFYDALKLFIRFYFDKVINSPYVSNQYRTSNTKGGIALRFSLSQ